MDDAVCVTLEVPPATVVLDAVCHPSTIVVIAMIDCHRHE
jgi:hypothetical protein